MDVFFGMGMMVACLKQVGTLDRCSERLNMEVNTSASWSAHPLRTRPGTPSGPDDFRGFTLWSSRLTSAIVRDRMQSPGPRPVLRIEGGWLPQTFRKKC